MENEPIQLLQFFVCEDFEFDAEEGKTYGIVSDNNANYFNATAISISTYKPQSVNFVLDPFSYLRTHVKNVSQMYWELQIWTDVGGKIWKLDGYNTDSTVLITYPGNRNGKITWSKSIPYNPVDSTRTFYFQAFDTITSDFNY